MHFALSTLVILFALPMALWPLAWLVVVIRNAVARRWQRVGQLGWLLPLWTVAASIGAMQLAPLLAASNDAKSSPRLLIAATSIGVAVCFAAVAWLLLIRSFASQRSTTASSGTQPRPAQG